MKTDGVKKQHPDQQPGFARQIFNLPAASIELY
jgi:hypothetical protein